MGIERKLGNGVVELPGSQLEPCSFLPFKNQGGEENDAVEAGKRSLREM